MAIEFHFDFGSPNAYLSHLVMPQIVARTGIAVAYIPVLLGGVFKATGNASPAVTLQGIKNKGEYQRLETTRFLQKHAITRYTANAATGFTSIVIGSPYKKYGLFACRIRSPNKPRRFVTAPWTVNFTTGAASCSRPVLVG